MNKIDGSRVNLYLTFSIETLMTPKRISCCLTWKQKQKCNATKTLNPICFTPRENKGDREGIPHTHPIPQVIRLELCLRPQIPRGIRQQPIT